MSPNDIPKAPIDIDMDAMKQMEVLYKYIDDVALKIGRDFINNPKEGGRSVFVDHREELSKALAIIESIKSDLSTMIYLNMIPAISDVKEKTEGVWSAVNYLNDKEKEIATCYNR